MENADLGEQGPKKGGLGEGLPRKTREITAKLSKEDLIAILSRLIGYAEKRLYGTHTRVKYKPTWARILRESVTF